MPISFEYMTQRIRITPRDLCDTKLARPPVLHFICSPSRASAIVADVQEVHEWVPMTIYEPIPVRSFNFSAERTSNMFMEDRCLPEELPALTKVLPLISILRWALFHFGALFKF